MGGLDTSSSSRRNSLKNNNDATAAVITDNNKTLLRKSSTSNMSNATTTSSSNNNNNMSLLQELRISYELVFSSKLMWLLLFGPIALIGDTTGIFGEALCFTCSGIALIPCAERLSFVTEQVACHTNGTIGALLNATFGNAPELLISTSALRAGFYRVVQLAMLGSMLTNLLFVFGVSCLIGGIRWQIQELRIISGNINIGMLLAATAGSLLPAALSYSGELKHHSAEKHQHQVDEYGYDMPTKEELAYCRLNAIIMMILYISYLIFQLGTHKEEFDDDDDDDEEQESYNNNDDYIENFIEHNNHYHGQQQQQQRLDQGYTSPSKRQRTRFFGSIAKRNKFCLRFWTLNPAIFDDDDTANSKNNDDHEQLGLLLANANATPRDGNEPKRKKSDTNFDLPLDDQEGSSLESGTGGSYGGNQDIHRRRGGGGGGRNTNNNITRDPPPSMIQDDSYEDDYNQQNNISNIETTTNGGNSSTTNVTNNKAMGESDGGGKVYIIGTDSNNNNNAKPKKEKIMSLRTGIFWLLIITMCVSAMSDILVDTIDGFAFRSHISEVFTSMVIIPFFSNIAEQVSAIIFAYHNKMDLCVGVTVGSAIQIALFVLPGCVIIGQIVDRSMTLYFKGFETCCLFFGVIVVAAILQGGTTNWLSGMICIGIYIIIASGIWFHELEDLSKDAEAIYENYSSSSSNNTNI